MKKRTEPKLMNSGKIAMLAMIMFAVGCSDEGKTIAAGNAKSEDAHIIAYSNWESDADPARSEHQVIVQNEQEILAKVSVGGSPIKLLSGSREDLAVVSIKEGEIVSIVNQAAKSMLKMSRLPKATSIAVQADGVFGFDKDLPAIWRWSFGTETESTILAGDELVRVLGKAPDKKKTGYLGKLAVSPSGDRIALTVPGDTLLNEQAQDWNSEVYVVSSSGEHATKLGLGMPLFWLDEDRVMVWNIEPGKDAHRRFVARIYSTSGEVLAEQDLVGSIAWSGKNLYIVRVDPAGYSKRLEQPEVEIWSDDLKRRVSSFRLKTSFVNAYSSNFIALQ